MKKLTKKQLDNMYGFNGDNEKRQALGNGEIGYCAETKTIVVCCGNCGDYTHINITQLLK
jgi:hypothetical protein